MRTTFSGYKKIDGAMIYRFDGKTYDKHLDYNRLKSQLSKVFHAMLDGRWHTLEDLVDIVESGTVASVSARLRDLRKFKFGAYLIRTKRNDEGLWKYKLALDENGSPCINHEMRDVFRDPNTHKYADWLKDELIVRIVKLEARVEKLKDR